MAPFAHSEHYTEDQAKRHIPRILAAGTSAWREAALDGDLLYPLPGENRDYYLPEEMPKGGRKTAFEHRVRCSALRNVWLKSVRSAALAPLSEPIGMQDWPEQVEEWLASMTGTAGQNLVQYMIGVLPNQAIDGIHFTLVELPRVLDSEGRPVVRSVGDDVRGSVRPYTIPLAAADVDAMEVGRIGGETALLRAAVFLQETQDGKKRAVWREYRLEGDRVEWRDNPLKEPKRDAEVDEDLKIGRAS